MRRFGRREESNNYFLDNTTNILIMLFNMGEQEGKSSSFDLLNDREKGVVGRARESVSSFLVGGNKPMQILTVKQQ